MQDEAGSLKHSADPLSYVYSSCVMKWWTQTIRTVPNDFMWLAVADLKQRDGRCILYTVCSAYRVWPTSLNPLRYIRHFSCYVACSVIPCQYLFLPFLPHLAQRGSVHSSRWPNQVWIELTAVCQFFLALRLQICNLCCCLLGIFNSNINTGIVSCKYIKCHCWPDSRYWLQPPSLDRHTLRQNYMHFCMFAFMATLWNGNREAMKKWFLWKYIFLSKCILLCHHTMHMRS